MSRGPCHFCGRPVEVVHTAAWPVNGWEIERGAGGANQIVGRERVLDGRIAHGPCVRTAVDRARRGISPDQAQLV